MSLSLCQDIYTYKFDLLIIPEGRYYCHSILKMKQLRFRVVQSHMAIWKVEFHIPSQAVCPDPVYLVNISEGNKRREEVSCVEQS